MKSKVGITFISIIILFLVIVLALLANHLYCEYNDAPQTLVDIDNKAVDIVISVNNSITEFFDYVKYLYLKVTAIQTPEYPSIYLPMYPDSRVTSYSYDDASNTLTMSTGTNDTFSDICLNYADVFSGDITVDYFKQYTLDKRYTAYGMIGNFTFLLEVVPSDDEKYTYDINTQLHYLVGNELAMENFFRQQSGPSTIVFTNPYIYMYQIPGDTDGIYLQLKDYKSQLLNLDTHVELYVDDTFITSRYYGDSVRVPVNILYGLHDIKMISFDNNNCIRAIDILEKSICYDAGSKADFYDLASNYSDAKNLYLLNTGSIEQISYIEYFSQLESLYFVGNNLITDYSPLLNLSSLNRLFIKNINADIVKDIKKLEKLNILQISNYHNEILLGEYFKDTKCKELILDNCSDIYFDDNGLFSADLERLEISYNNSLDAIAFLAPYPNIRIVELSHCDSLQTLLKTTNLKSINMLTINSCSKIDLSQPLGNNSSLIHINFKDNTGFTNASKEYINSVWTNNNLVVFNANNCSNLDNINYYSRPWEKVN